MQINNSYTLRKIAEITGGKCIGNVDSTINNIHFDSRRFVKNNKHLFIAFKTNFNDGHLYINEVYKSGIKQFITHTKPDDLKSDAGYLIVNNTLIALQKWASFHREKFNFPVLSISGSYGKTVIKEWINYIAEEKLNIIRSPKSYNSQFGAALTLLSIRENHQLAIVETGISKPGEMSLMKKMIQPSHVILSNIGNEHLENFNSIDELRLEKEKILEKTCFTYFKDYKQLDSNRSIKENGQEISWIYNQKKEIFFLGQKDEFSAKNFICCLSFLNQISFDVQEIKKLSPFLPEIALRFEKKAGINQSTIFNDSYQNNIQSLKIALETLKSESVSSKSTLILGDLDEKNINYNDLVDLIKSYKLYRFVGIGKEIYKNRKSFIGESSFFEDESSFFKKFNSFKFDNECILIKGKKATDFQKISLRLEEKKHNTVLEINLSNLIKNLNYYRNIVPNKTKLLVMIKAAGYGTGLIESAKILEKNHIDYLGVAYTDEGVELRKKGLKSPILIMNVEQKSMDNLIENNLTPSIHDISQLDELTKKLITLGIKNFPIHIKLNTGMNRMGFDPNEINKLCSFLFCQPEIKVEGIFSHLAASDLENGKKLTQKQFKLFHELSSEIESKLGVNSMKHILNTSGIENYIDHSLDMVRLGIGLYGVSKNERLSNVASLVSKISKIRNIIKGDYIGYGINNIAKKDITIAIIPIGYADGFSRLFGNGNGHVWINNSLHSTVGNICMDMMFIDVTNKKVKINDRVEIFGNNYSIIEMAKSINTIPYEIISTISNRVVRVYQKD
mgnify:FL=1